MPTLPALFTMLLKLNCILHLESFHIFELEQQFPICLTRGRISKCRIEMVLFYFHVHRWDWFGLHRSIKLSWHLETYSVRRHRFQSFKTQWGTMRRLKFSGNASSNTVKHERILPFPLLWPFLCSRMTFPHFKTRTKQGAFVDVIRAQGEWL